MVDLHNHILPGVDDGARDLEEALTMARQAVAVGTTIMAATPHRLHAGHEQLRPMIEAGVAELQGNLDRRTIPLRLVAGIELPMRLDSAEKLQAGELIPLGGRDGKYVLIEPPFDRIPALALTVLESILDLGMIPLIAHPERNAELQRSLVFLETCASRGMPLQITAGSILGKFGPAPQACAKAIAMRRDWISIISSDAHDPRDRTPGDMRLAVEMVAGWIGDEAAAMKMADDLPRSFLPG